MEGQDFSNDFSDESDFEETRMGPRFARPPASSVPVQGVGRVWYKV